MPPPRQPHPPDTGLDPTVLACAVTLGLGLVAMLWRMASEPLEHGYVRYAGIAVRMVTDGDWVAMRLGDRLYLDKPPLYVWAIALPMAVFGRAAPWMPHVPNVLGAGLALFWTQRLAARLFAERWAAWAAPGILASTWLFYSLIRGKRLDPLFAAWLTGAFYYAHAALTAREDEAPRIATGAALGACLAAATLTKGPLALLFFATVVGPFAIWERRRMAPRTIGVALAVLVALTAPWPILLVRELGPDHLLAALRSNAFTTRDAGPLHYVLHLPIAMLPWTVLLPALVAWLAVERPWRSSSAVRFLLCWILGVLVPLQVSPARHSRYLLPAYPALALLLVALWAHQRERGASLPRLAWIARLRDAGLWAIPAGLALGIAAPLSVGLWAEHVDVPAAPVAAALAVLGAASLVVLLRRARWHDRAPAAVVPLALLALACFDLFRGLELRTSQPHGGPPILADLAAAAPARVRAFGLGERDELSTELSAGESIPSVGSAEELRAWLEAPGTVGGRWVVTDADSVDDFPVVPELRVTRRLRLPLESRQPVWAIELSRRDPQPLEP